jgi:hypothetical protein
MPLLQDHLTRGTSLFPRQTDSGAMMVRVNFPGWEVLQRESYPWRIWAVTTLKAPDENGIAGDEEAQGLLDAERELILRVPDDDHTVYLGSVQHQFQHVAVLYTRIPDVLGNPPACRIKGRRYTWHVYTENDPDYNFLRINFLPDATEIRRVRDDEVLQALAGAHDNPNAPRLITFYGMFPHLRDAEMAAADLTKKGFRPTAPSEMPGKGYYQWSLMFQRVSTTDATSIERVSALCQDVCTACNGYFDGWECEPQRS